MYTPDLLTMTDGTPVTSSAQWEARRGELLNILAREQYGTFLPPSTASARVMAPPMPVCAGHALQETLEVRFDTPAGEFAFPLRFLYPADGQVHPLFLLPRDVPRKGHRCEAGWNIQSVDGKRQK